MTVSVHFRRLRAQYSTGADAVQVWEAGTTLPGTTG